MWNTCPTWWLDHRCKAVYTQSKFQYLVCSWCLSFYITPSPPTHNCFLFWGSWLCSVLYVCELPSCLLMTLHTHLQTHDREILYCTYCIKSVDWWQEDTPPLPNPINRRPFVFKIYPCFMCVSVLPGCMYLYHVRAWCLCGLEEGTGFPGTGVTGWELPCGCWISNPGPLQEQPVLLYTEPSTTPIFKEFQGTLFCFLR